MGETSIVHHEDRIAIDIDLACAALPPLSHLRYIRTTSAEELDYESFAISHPENLRVTPGRIAVDLYALRPVAEQSNSPAELSVSLEPER